MPPGGAGTIGILIVSAFVVILNETTMNIALREIMADMGVDERTAQWLATAFLLTMAVVIPVTGRLLQRVRTRPLFLGAMGAFATGTLLAALAPGFPVLLAARVVQACGTAVMMPLLMTTIMELVPASRRGRFMGNVSVVIAVAPAVGPVLSGLVLSFASWRWVFLTVLPIAVLMLGIGAWRLRDVGELRPARVDPLSVPLAAAGFGGLVFAFTRFGGEGGGPWADPLPFLLLAGSLAVLALFAWRQRVLQRRDEALLDLRVLRSAGYRAGVVIISLSMLVLLGTVILLPLLMQGAFGLEPLQVGLVTLPGGLLMGVVGKIAGRLSDRYGARPLVIAGTCVTASTCLLYAMLLSPYTPWWFFSVVHMCTCLGLAFTFTPVFSTALGSLPREQYSHGSAFMSTMQQLGGAAGTAVFVTVMVAFGGGAAEAGGDARGIVSGARIAFALGCGIGLLAVAASWRLRDARQAEPGAAQPRS